MNDENRVTAAIETLLPERLQRMKRSTGLSVVFGGTTQQRQFVLSRSLGTFGDTLRGLAIRPGAGMGGRVLVHGVAQRVNDYANTSSITHEYDQFVVHNERLTSVITLPLRVHGQVRGVLYGAVRDQNPIGDRALRQATVVATQFQRDVERTLDLSAPALPTRHPLAELAELTAEITDPVLRARLERITAELGGYPTTANPLGPLSRREVEVLRLVATGATNVEVAAEVGLRPETVKAYLRSSMRKLAVSNRTAAVHAARRAGLL